MPKKQLQKLLSIPLVKSASRFTSPVFFLLGFLWDSLTLKRVDNSLDLIILGFYLTVSATIVILLLKNITFKFSDKLPSFLQFLFGGLFSAFVVFYFQSASSFLSILFVMLIVSLLVFNEFTKRHLSKSVLNILLWSFSAQMYLSFMLPTILGKMNTLIFSLSLIIPLLLFALIKKFFKNHSLSFIPISILFSLIAIMYLTNIIPPIPLSTKHIGIYSSVSRIEDKFVCKKEDNGFFSNSFTNNISYQRGQDTIFCFSSIFAPTKLQKKIFHTWYFYNATKGKFIKTDNLGFKIIGGRISGYRGYTYKANLETGLWKVKIKTDDNLTLGSIKFTVINADTNKISEFSELNY